MAEDKKKNKAKAEHKNKMVVPQLKKTGAPNG